VLPGTPALRREQIKLQVALVNALMHLRGYAAPESKAAVEQTRLYIERAEALGEPPEDPLVLFSVLYGVWVANYAAFNGDVMCELAAQFMALAEKQGATAPRMVGHRLVGTSLLSAGAMAQGRAHFDSALALYDPVAHRPLVTRFGQDVRVAILAYRAWALCFLGYPEAALADAEYALNDARETGHAATVMYALYLASVTHLECRNYARASAEADELISLADEKGTLFWKAFGMLGRGSVLAVSGKSADAVQPLTAAIAGFRSTGAKVGLPLYLSYLATAYAQLGRYDESLRSIDEAMAAKEATKERWWEADIHRMAGEISLRLPAPDAAKAQAYFEQALALARAQQAKFWELRAAMSMARLWRDQGKRDEARDLLAPVYGWFTEGFDMRDLTEARALLKALA
jgi:predicted ATPase